MSRSGEADSASASRAAADACYAERIRETHRLLGISPEYAPARGLALCEEANELEWLADASSQQEHGLTPETHACWAALADAARDDGVEIFIVSAFRSVGRQVEIIQGKLERGEVLSRVLEVNAAPGYSEHHTGCALDLGTPGCPILTEAFEATSAFAWLCERAAEFGFRMSYPRDNPHGFVYEPWHWACEGGAGAGGRGSE